MTDLATLLRADLAATEPSGGLDASRPVHEGRRRLRRRRILGTVAVVAAVAAATVTPFLLLGGDRSPAVVEPPPYDAEQMPRILDQHARAVLERSVPDLGTVTFSAEAEHSVRELPPGRYDEAATMRLNYGPVEHRFRVSVLHAGSEAEGPVDQICALSVANHLEYECEVSRTGDLVVVTTLRAMQPQLPDPLNDRRGHTVVRTDELDQVPPERRWFVRTAKVIKSDTLLAYVSESVRAPTLADALEEFLVPVEDLVELGTDPALAIPEPPAH